MQKQQQQKQFWYVHSLMYFHCIYALYVILNFVFDSLYILPWKVTFLLRNNIRFRCKCTWQIIFPVEI